MVRAKFITRNEVCVIDNGKSYLFDLAGKCVKEDAGLIPKYTDGMLALPILSILSCNGVLDIAVFNVAGDSMQRYKTDLDSMTCALTAQKYGNFLKILRRDGKEGDKLFNQLLFLYKEGSSLSPLLNELHAEAVTDEC